MRVYEVYQNNFVANSPGSDGSLAPFISALGSRGGVGLVFGNTATTSNGAGFNQVFDVTNMRSFTEIWSPTFGHCTGSNPWDQNAGSGGYRCLDQIGAEKGTMISGDEPSPVRWPPQQLEPTYVWRNTKNGAHSPTAIRAGVIGDNRDIYSENESFNGSTGVGVGPLGNRPSSCTAGVAYWATDQGESGDEPVTGPLAPAAARADLYVWRNNEERRALADGESEAGVIGDNRDIYSENESFNGSTGVGVGPLGKPVSVELHRGRRGTGRRTGASGTAPMVNP